MPEPKAEDDDEEGFGDFKFASFPNRTVHSDHTNGRNSTDDDEWGDFVEYPLRSSPPTHLSRHKSPPIPDPSQPTNQFDPLGFISDHSTKPSDSAPNRTESGKNQWMKPKGALPLSLFGDVEDEDEQSGVADPPVVVDAKPSVANGSRVDFGGGIDDIIATLYSQNQQMKAENGSISISNGLISSGDGINSNTNGAISNSNGINLDTNGSISNPNWLSSSVDGIDLNASGSVSKSNGLSSSADGIDLHVNGSISNASGLNVNSGLVDGNKDFDAIADLFNESKQINGESRSQMSLPTSNFSGFELSFTGLNSESDIQGGNDDDFDDGWEFKDAHSEPNVGDGSANVINSNSDLLNKESGGDDDGWEFMDAYSESNVRDGNANVTNSKWDPLGVNLDSNGDGGGWEFEEAYTEANAKDGNAKVDKKGQVDLFSSGFGNGLHGNIDLFTKPNDFSIKSSEMNIGFDSKPLTVTQNSFSFESLFDSELNHKENKMNSDLLMKKENGLTSDPVAESADLDESFGEFEHAFSERKMNSDLLMKKENGLTSDPVMESADLDESFGEFEHAFSESGPKQEEDEPKFNGLFHSEVDGSTSNGKIQGNESGSENKTALPLSIFGDNELEDASLNSQDIMHTPTSFPRNGIHLQGSHISINDLISNLYSQAEKNPYPDSTQKPSEDGLDATGIVLDSNLVNDDGDFDDDSWEFKDASQNEAKDQPNLLSHEDESSSKLKLNNYVDFYSKLEDELCFSTRCHLDSLKKARTTAALSSDDAKVFALDEEIQDICKELYQEHRISKEVYSEDHPPRDISLNEFFQVLQEPNFQLLDSEYHLSRKLQLAEKDPRSMIELLKHVTSVLNLLTLGSVEEQSNYVSTWSKIIAVCAQELEHGAQIWKQSLVENVRSQILSDPRGKQFILALGEVYRVVVVIGASVKLYKPWITLNSVDSTNIYALLEECYTLWSVSGLEEALQSICNPIGIEYEGTVKALLESIKHIYDLDELALGSHVFSKQEPLCLLSGLTLGTVPDIKMVEWNGEHYFLSLANLWANLISRDPPKLPHLLVGQ